MFEKIIYRLLFVVIIFVLSNYIYKYFFLEQDIQKNSSIINLVRTIPNDVDIIYFGESSNTTYKKNDIEKKYISEFIGDYFPQLKIADISKPASHAGIYKVLLANIPEEKKVTTIIITLNLRSFNAQWIYSELETSLQKSLVLLKPYPPIINRFLLSFKAYDIKTEKERQEQFNKKWVRDEFVLPFEFPFNNVKEWDSWMWQNGIKDSLGNKDDKLSELACHYIKAYGFQIDTLNNPRIKDFNDIIEFAKTRNWNLVFNLLSENTEKASQLVGKDLIYLMEENCNLLTSYFQRRNVLVVNNLHAVSDEDFIDQTWTTEHYAERGRKLIALNVANSLKEFYPNYFKPIE